MEKLISKKFEKKKIKRRGLPAIRAFLYMKTRKNSTGRFSNFKL